MKKRIIATDPEPSVPAEKPPDIVPQSSLASDEPSEDALCQAHEPEDGDRKPQQHLIPEISEAPQMEAIAIIASDRTQVEEASQTPHALRVIAEKKRDVMPQRALDADEPQVGGEYQVSEPTDRDLNLRSEIPELVVVSHTPSEVPVMATNESEIEKSAATTASEWTQLVKASLTPDWVEDTQMPDLVEATETPRPDKQEPSTSKAWPEEPELDTPIEIRCRETSPWKMPLWRSLPAEHGDDFDVPVGPAARRTPGHQEGRQSPEVVRYTPTETVVIHESGMLLSSSDSGSSMDAEQPVQTEGIAREVESDSESGEDKELKVIYLAKTFSQESLKTGSPPSWAIELERDMQTLDRLGEEYERKVKEKERIKAERKLERREPIETQDSNRNSRAPIKITDLNLPVVYMPKTDETIEHQGEQVREPSQEIIEQLHEIAELQFARYNQPSIPFSQERGHSQERAYYEPGMQEPWGRPGSGHDFPRTVIKTEYHAHMSTLNNQTTTVGDDERKFKLIRLVENWSTESLMSTNVAACQMEEERKEREKYDEEIERMRRLREQKRQERERLQKEKERLQAVWQNADSTEQPETEGWASPVFGINFIADSAEENFPEAARCLEDGDSDTPLDLSMDLPLDLSVSKSSVGVSSGRPHDDETKTDSEDLSLSEDDLVDEEGYDAEDFSFESEEMHESYSRTQGRSHIRRHLVRSEYTARIESVSTLSGQEDDVVRLLESWSVESITSMASTSSSIELDRSGRAAERERLRLERARFHEEENRRIIVPAPDSHRFAAPSSMGFVYEGGVVNKRPDNRAIATEDVVEDSTVVPAPVTLPQREANDTDELKLREVSLYPHQDTEQSTEIPPRRTIARHNLIESSTVETSFFTSLPPWATQNAELLEELEGRPPRPESRRGLNVYSKREPRRSTRRLGARALETLPELHETHRLPRVTSYSSPLAPRLVDYSRRGARQDPVIRNLVQVIATSSRESSWKSKLPQWAEHTSEFMEGVVPPEDNSRALTVTSAAEEQRSPTPPAGGIFNPYEALAQYAPQSEGVQGVLPLRVPEMMESYEWSVEEGRVIQTTRRQTITKVPDEEPAMYKVVQLVKSWSVESLHKDDTKEKEKKSIKPTLAEELATVVASGAHLPSNLLASILDGPTPTPSLTEIIRQEEEQSNPSYQPPIVPALVLDESLERAHEPLEEARGLSEDANSTTERTCNSVRGAYVPAEGYYPVEGSNFPMPEGAYVPIHVRPHGQMPRPYGPYGPDGAYAPLPEEYLTAAGAYGPIGHYVPAQGQYVPVQDMYAPMRRPCDSMEGRVGPTLDRYSRMEEYGPHDNPTAPNYMWVIRDLRPPPLEARDLNEERSKFEERERKRASHKEEPEEGFIYMPSLPAASSHGGTRGVGRHHTYHDIQYEPGYVPENAYFDPNTDKYATEGEFFDSVKFEEMYGPQRGSHRLRRRGVKYVNSLETIKELPAPDEETEELEENWSVELVLSSTSTMSATSINEESYGSQRYDDEHEEPPWITKEMDEHSSRYKSIVTLVNPLAEIGGLSHLFEVDWNKPHTILEEEEQKMLSPHRQQGEQPLVADQSSDLPPEAMIEYPQNSNSPLKLVKVPKKGSSKGYIVLMLESPRPPMDEDEDELSVVSPAGYPRAGTSGLGNKSPANKHEDIEDPWKFDDSDEEDTDDDGNYKMKQE